jgi:DNA-binding PadR family transcriptional regulator
MREKETARLPELGGALLALLDQEPRSGYDLRKLFTTTPLAHFSDSPGSIYPALRRLQTRGLIAGRRERTQTLRPRQLFVVTPRGLAALRAWLRSSYERNGVLDVQAAMIRFVFVPEVLGAAAAREFIAELEAKLAAYVKQLKTFYEASQAAMTRGGRLGLFNGVLTFTAHLRWARLARRELASEERKI